MRTSITLFASAMLAAAPLVLAGEGYGSYSHDCEESSTYWKPPPPPASSIYPSYTYTETGTYPSSTPIPASIWSSYPITRTSTVTATGSGYPKWNSTMTMTASYHPTGYTSLPTYPPTTPTPPTSTGGAAPMGLSYPAGIVGAVGALFALL